jgi:hypothetical protein
VNRTYHVRLKVVALTFATTRRERTAGMDQTQTQPRSQLLHRTVDVMEYNRPLRPLLEERELG